MRRIGLLMLLLPGGSLLAQVEGVPRDLIEQRIEAAVEQLGGDSDVDLTNLFEVLTDRYVDPIDLNHTDGKELHALLLLTDMQINAILQHRRRNGKFLSIYELQTVQTLDAHAIALIRPFVTVRESPLSSSASLKEILRNGSHEIMARSTMTLQQRRGYMHRRWPYGSLYARPDGQPLPDMDDPAVVDSLERNNRVYLGSPYRLYTRYRFRYRHNLSLGFTVEKDEGEQFFRGTQPQGFDFFSGHFFLRDAGRFKAIAIGDYSAQFGQGLTFWNGLAFASKSSFTMNVKRNAVGLLPYTSVNENLFMRGVAATYVLSRNWELTAAISRKRLDAALSALPAGEDTTGTAIPEVIFTSFQEDGFHRTYAEVAKKGAVQENIRMGHLRYRRNAFSIGGTVAHVAFDTELRRNVRPYNQFEFNGRENTTMGVDWNLLHRNANWFGEVARSANGGVAMNTGVLVALDKRVSMSLLYRDYRRDFQGLYSVAFAEGTNPWNERGFFTGIEIRPNRQWTFNAYFDQFRFPWLRYLTDAPSEGTDWLAQLNWRPSKRVELYVRTRQQDRARNTGEAVTGLRPVVRMGQVNHRFNASYRVTDAITLRTRIETVDFQRGDLPVRHGFLLYQDLVHRPVMSPVELTLRVALFDTEGYDARIYAFENDLIGVFSIPPYYGRGMRWYGMLRATPLRRVDVWVRYGAWIYRDQQVIGSGLQEISGSLRSDMKVQVRVRF
jgi:hypothetical protein